MENIIIPDKKKLEETIKKISKQGKNKFHVLADFDRTLTKGKFNGDAKVTSIINLIALGGHLNKDYQEKANELYEKYYVIEHNLNIPLEKKRKEMVNWWTKHSQLLIDSGLNLKVLKEVVKKNNPHFRESIFNFLDILKKNKIPLVILSASRRIMIKMFLEKYNYMNKNIHIISNNFEFDESGKATGFTKPIIHSFNKHETEINKLPVYKELLKKKNVLLLGDSLGDVGMVEGFPYENLIKIGFLNHDAKKNLDKYKEVYDVVILNDGSFDYINELIERIINKT